MGHLRRVVWGEGAKPAYLPSTITLQYRRSLRLPVRENVRVSSAQPDLLERHPIQCQWKWGAPNVIVRMGLVGLAAVRPVVGRRESGTPACRPTAARCMTWRTPWKCYTS